MDKLKKSKKSKHGKKNWRKNIDVVDIEKAENLRNQEKLDKNRIKQMSDEELFELNTNKKEFIGKKIKKKEEKKKKNKKLSKMEQRKIKRIIEKEKEKVLFKKDENEKKKEIYDMWGNEEEYNNNLSNKNISYPILPLPHPGQSYNPNKKDLNHLLKKVVELNKKINNKEVNKKKEINRNNIFKSEDEDEDEEEINTSLIKISNNEPVSDLNRLTKKEKRIKEKKKVNKLIDKQNIENKKLKLEI